MLNRFTCDRVSGRPSHVTKIRTEFDTGKLCSSHCMRPANA